MNVPKIFTQLLQLFILVTVFAAGTVTACILDQEPDNWLNITQLDNNSNNFNQSKNISLPSKSDAHHSVATSEIPHHNCVCCDACQCANCIGCNGCNITKIAIISDTSRNQSSSFNIFHKALNLYASDPPIPLRHPPK